MVGSCPSLAVLSGQSIFIIIRRHLSIKACNLPNVFCYCLGHGCIQYLNWVENKIFIFWSKISLHVGGDGNGLGSFTQSGIRRSCSLDGVALALRCHDGDDLVRWRGHVGRTRNDSSDADWQSQGWTGLLLFWSCVSYTLFYYTRSVTEWICLYTVSQKNWTPETFYYNIALISI